MATQQQNQQKGRTRRRRKDAAQDSKQDFSSFMPGEEPLIAKPLAEQMKVDLLVNEDSQIWLLHDLPFPEILKWAEFDPDLGQILIYTESGKTYPLGLTLPDDMQDLLCEAEDIYIVRVKDGVFDDFYILPLTIQPDLLH